MGWGGATPPPPTKQANWAVGHTGDPTAVPPSKLPRRRPSLVPQGWTWKSAWETIPNPHHLLGRRAHLTLRANLVIIRSAPVASQDYDGHQSQACRWFGQVRTVWKLDFFTSWRKRSLTTGQRALLLVGSGNGHSWAWKSHKRFTVAPGQRSLKQSFTAKGNCSSSNKKRICKNTKGKTPTGKAPPMGYRITRDPNSMQLQTKAGASGPERCPNPPEVILHEVEVASKTSEATRSATETLCSAWSPTSPGEQREGKARSVRECPQGTGKQLLK